MRARLFGVLTLRHLEWAAVAAPLLFLGLSYYLMLGPLHTIFHSWYGFLLLWASLLAAVLTFARAVFGAVRRMQREIEQLHEQTRRHNEQLVAMHGANLALMRVTNFDFALQRIVQLSARLVGTRYAALAAVGDNGDLTRFVSEGPGVDTNGDPQGMAPIRELLRAPGSMPTLRVTRRRTCTSC